MNTQNNEYIPIPNSLSLVAIRERRLMNIKNVSKTVFSITWKACVYAFILTIANVII